MTKGRIIKTDGLVIRATECADGDSIYTFLSKDSGRLTIKARPPVSNRSVFMQKIGVGFYMELLLSKVGPLCYIRESEMKEAFWDLRDDSVRFALSEYLLDVAYELSEDAAECSEMLSLTSNCLYALCYNKDTDTDLIKAAFELKAMSVSGYMPDISSCRVCRKIDDDMYLDVMEGGIICRDCLKKTANELPYIAPEDSDFHMPEKIICPINFDVLCAMNYIIRAPIKKLLSFKLEGADTVSQLERATKTFLINHLERDFESMKFYYYMRDGMRRKKFEA